PARAISVNRACIVCGGTTSAPVFREFEIDVVRCRTCGHVFSSAAAEQDYDRYFGTARIEPDNQFWWDEAHRRMYDAFCRRFLAGRSGRLLDVGCGLGFFVRRASREHDWDVFGSEMSAPAVEFARDVLGLRTVVRGRVQDAGFEPSSFNVITLWDVIEHIPNPDVMLSHLRSLLTSDGMLFLHTPNVAVQLPKARFKRFLRGMRRGIHYLEAGDHAHLYSKKSIGAVLRRHGFGAVRFVHLPPIQSVSGGRAPLMRAAKNVWYYSAVALSTFSGGLLNYDNLFVIAARPHHA
ncbi:MAG: class I SAM-dependent methyltransferase, partial [bacterium]